MNQLLIICIVIIIAAIIIIYRHHNAPKILMAIPIKTTLIKGTDIYKWPGAFYIQSVATGNYFNATSSTLVSSLTDATMFNGASMSISISIKNTASSMLNTATDTETVVFPKIGGQSWIIGAYGNGAMLYKNNAGAPSGLAIGSDGTLTFGTPLNGSINSNVSNPTFAVQFIGINQ